MACHQQALELAGAIGSSLDEVCALAGLGRCAMISGHTAQAKVLLRQAHETYQRIGAAEASAGGGRSRTVGRQVPLGVRIQVRLGRIASGQNAQTGIK